MKTNNRELRDWFIITVIILIGFLLLIIAGAQAMRFSPRWQMSANMRSDLDPDSDFLTSRPQGFVEPVDIFILTQPVWIDLFQTPGATIPERVRPTSAKIIPVFPTAAPTGTPIPSPTLIMTLYPTQVMVNPTLAATATFTEQPFPEKSPTPITPVVPPAQADLLISKDDHVSLYTAGMTLTYTVIVSNAGPDDVTDAIISDAKPSQIEEWSWACSTQTGAASGCDPKSTNKEDFTDTVDLPAGSSMEYTVTAKVRVDASGELANSASIGSASITDPDTNNNNSADNDQFQAPSIGQEGEIGPVKDKIIEYLDPGEDLVLTINPPLQVGVHDGYDIILYEMQNGTGIAMDLIIVDIGDGVNWTTIFNWGDGKPDTNSNLNINVIGGTESDNRAFTTPPESDILVNVTGITIELDNYASKGSYPYLRLRCPIIDNNGRCEIDAIAIVP